jgi:hypothetical protein
MVEQPAPDVNRQPSVRSRRDWPFLIDLANQVSSLIRSGQDWPFRGVGLSGLPLGLAQPGFCAPAIRTYQNVRSLRPKWASGGSGGAAVWLDAVLAEQVAQPIELPVQPLVFREHGLTAHADCELLLQP